MGSVTSRPKVPTISQPQVVYVPAPVSPATASVNDQSSAEGDTQNQVDIRRNNLLTRSRGRLGTVTTSFRGLLGDTAQTDTRKTLLGE